MPNRLAQDGGGIRFHDKSDRPETHQTLKEIMPRLRLFAASAPLFGLIALSSCGQGPVLDIRDPVVKLNPIAKNPSALYFTIHGGPKATTLEDVFSPGAVQTSMHESVRDPRTGITRMKPLLRVPIPADTDVEFRPGGKHVMLYGINLPARRLNEIDVTFVFGNGDRLPVTVPIARAEGDDGDMEGMDMGGASAANSAPMPAATTASN